MLCLADMYRLGLGVEKSVKKALKLYNKASERGFSKATSALAGLYWEGCGIDVDRDKAMQLYHRAAHQGSPWGQYYTANFLRETGNLEEAFLYCKLAAEQGLAQAEHHLALHYMRGHGVGRDFEEGRRWCARAAANGAEEARTMLKEIDAEFEKVREAAARGYEPAIKQLADLNLAIGGWRT